MKLNKKTIKASNHLPLLKLIRPIRLLDTNESKYRVEFRDLKGKKQKVDISRSAFSGRMEVINILMDLHASMPHDRESQKALVQDALDRGCKNTQTLDMSNRIGWEPDSAEPSFVYFNRTHGPKSASLKYDPSAPRNPALGMSKGSLDAWIAGLKPACEIADQLVFAIAVAASGPLYKLCAVSEGTVYHFQGAIAPKRDGHVWKSSSGKTLSALAAVSTFGRALRTDLFGFETTQAALEETCASSNCLAVVLDEEGTAGEGGGGHTVSAKRLPYLVAGGRSKSRSQRSAQPFRNLTWTVAVITTSEDELDAGGKSNRKEGAQVRMVAVPFPPTWEGGMFDNVSLDVGRELAKSVEATISQNFGVLMPEFLDQVAQNYQSLLNDIPAMIEEFIKTVIPGSSNSWEYRFASKFAIVAVAARLLAKYQLAPWTEERGIGAVTAIYMASRAMSVSIPECTDSLISRLKALVSKKKFIFRLKKGQKMNSAKRKATIGIIRKIDGKVGVTVIPWTKFRKLVEPSAVAEQVLTELDSRGLIVKAADGALRRQVQISGLSSSRPRCVCVRRLVPKKASRNSAAK